MRLRLVLAALCAALFLVPAAPAASSSYRLRVWETAYCLRGTTATDTRVHWGSVAVDPRVIRLGTSLWIPGYGRGRAEDTGGGVWGRHIDVWVPRCGMAGRFTRSVTITVFG